MHWNWSSSWVCSLMSNEIEISIWRHFYNNSLWVLSTASGIKMSFLSLRAVEISSDRSWVLALLKDVSSVRTNFLEWPQSRKVQYLVLRKAEETMVTPHRHAGGAKLQHMQTSGHLRTFLFSGGLKDQSDLIFRSSWLQTCHEAKAFLLILWEPVLDLSAGALLKSPCGNWVPTPALGRSFWDVV